MEEPEVPLLLDLQLFDPRFVFEPKTIQRMELWVLANLRWRLRSVTPFDYLEHFISRLPSSSDPKPESITRLLSDASGLILSATRGTIYPNPIPFSYLDPLICLFTNQFYYLFFDALIWYFVDNVSVIDFLAFPPSTIAAAAVLWAAGRSLPPPCFHDRVNNVHCIFFCCEYKIRFY